MTESGSEIRMEDGDRARIGDVVWNYYDMRKCLIDRIDDETDPIGQTWCGVRYRCEDGSWSPVTDTLSDSRMCSLETARRKGWLK